MTPLTLLSSPQTDSYHIPQDTGTPWRWKRMIDYIVNAPDDTGLLIRDYSKHWTDSEKVYWAFLYSTCYCLPTSLVMFHSIPLHSIQYATLDQLRDTLTIFWNKNKQRLQFQTDRRYIKFRNQWVDAVLSFVSLVLKDIDTSIFTPARWLFNNTVSNDPYATYNNLYRSISSIPNYGRYATILFIRSLVKVTADSPCPIHVATNSYPWKEGRTTTSALMNAIYQDKIAADFDAGKYRLSLPDIRYLNTLMDTLTAQLTLRRPDTDNSIVSVSFDLCAYRKLFKSTRYPGYYVDRAQQEILNLDRDWYHEFPFMIDWFWDARKRLIPHIYLGELNDWTGVRKSLNSDFLQTGRVTP